MTEPVYTITTRQKEYQEPRIHHARHWIRKGSRLLADLEWYGNTMLHPKLYDKRGRREERSIPEIVRKENGTLCYVILREAFGEEAAVRFSVVFAVQLRVVGIRTSRDGDWEAETWRITHGELLEAVVDGTRKTA